MNRPRIIRWLRIFLLMNLGVNLGAVVGVLLGRLSPSNPIPLRLFGVGLGIIGASLCEWYLRASGDYPPRFSVRTLLIVTAVVAIVLGMVVWVVR